MSSRSLSSLLALGLYLSLASCSRAEVSSFPWKDTEGKALAFTRDDGEAKEREAILDTAAPAAVFSLKRAQAGGSGLWIEIEARTGLPLRLRFEILGLPETSPGGSGTSKAPAVLLVEELGLPDRLTKIYLEPPSGSLVGALRLSLLVQSPDSSLRLLGLGFGPAFRGFEKEGEEVILSPGFALVRQGSELVAKLRDPFGSSAFRLPGDEGTKETAKQPALRLAWSAAPDTAALELGAGDRRLARILRRNEAGAMVFPLSFFPSRPAELTLTLPSAVELLGFSTTLIPAEAARSLDLGVILALPLGSSPSGLPGLPDCDVYRWDLRAEVLVFDFADYAAQDRALKRLAFFVEKAGYKGSLAPDSEIAALHGWNAHDYRAADLASFFNAARTSSFRLGEAELGLRELLLRAGTLVAEGQGYAAGRGALISISRESPSWLRPTFMTHESSHALYFTDPAFADFVRASWAAVGAEERWFWKRYFAYMYYDTANEDLMANEFMAYLFQQPVAKVEEYFTKTLPTRLLEKHPELKARIDAYLSTWGPSFAIHAAAIEDWLRIRYGLSAGSTWRLR